MELLTSGDFETPFGVGEVPSWDLQEFATGTGTILNTAVVVGGTTAFSGDFQLWNQAFAGGMDVGPDNLTNSILSQTVPGIPGEQYTFVGHSRWEINYSGGLTTLFDGPLAGQNSPTNTLMRLEYLGSSGAVIGTPTVLDLRTEQNNFDNWVEHTLTSTAPPGTANVRVTAEARDMVWSVGPDQSAFYDTFSLTAGSDPLTEILGNPDLEEAPPSALDFWDLTENPETRDEILRTADFANHTPGGSLGVWLSAFFGQSSLFEPDPVDGTMSQTVDAVPGSEYTFSGWTLFEPNYSGGVDTIDPTNPDGNGGQPSPTQTLLELAFLNGSGDVIGTPDIIDLKVDRRLQSPTNNANDNEWYQHVASGIAPVGTVSARVSGYMIDGVFNTDTGGGQSAFFDDFSLQGPGDGVTGDFNGDGNWDCADINALTAAIATGSTDLAFDMNGDGSITIADVTEPDNGWLAVGGANNVAATGGGAFLSGDADLNGSVEVSDFNIWNGNKFTSSNAWCQGDFNADGFVDVPDFNAWNGNKFQSSSPAAAVPEPGTTAWLITFIAAWGVMPRRRR